METMNPTEHPYTPLFCEENIWQLAGRMLAEGAPPEHLWVLFFSNPDKQLVMLNQRRAGEQGYVVWDYHVVLMAGDQIYDFDTALPFPVSASDYFPNSFPHQSTLPEQYRGWVRCIPAPTYLQRFYSDRRHMHGVVDEKEFPSWPAITPAADHCVRLDQYWDMEKGLEDGSEVMDVVSFLHRLGG